MKIKLLTYVAFIFLLMWGVINFIQPGHPEANPTADKKNKIVITGSSTIAPLMTDLAHYLESENEKLQIDVQMGGSSKGLLDARNGLADIGMVSRSPKPGESDLVWTPIAKDGLAIIVHKNNPMTNINRETLKKIYRGEITKWEQISPQYSGPITVVHKAEGRSTLEVFLDFLGIKNSEIKPSIIIGDNQQGIKTVEGSGLAIAYISIGSAIVEAQINQQIKLLNLDGIEPTLQNVQNGQYPITRTLNLTFRKDHEGKIQELLKFVKSDQSQKFVQEQNFVALY